jgi:hypothetical protein
MGSLREKTQLMDATAMDRALTRIAHEIIERNRGVADVVLLGIQRRGVPLAKRLAAKLAQFEGEVEQQSWGSTIRLQVPGARPITLYQPKYDPPALTGDELEAMW